MNHIQYLRVALKDPSVERYIRLGRHVKERMEKRGYYTSDLRALINSDDSRLVEIRSGFNHKIQAICPTVTIEGKDADGNPFVAVFSQEGECQYSVVTAMPPLDPNRFNEVL